MARDVATEVKALAELWAAAVRSGDIDAVVANHPSDVVLFDVVPPFRVEGTAAFRAQWELFFRYSPGGPGSFDLQDLHIEAGETVAFGHATLAVAGTNVRLTLGFRKVGGRWVIAHEHHSVPGGAPD